MSISHKTLYVVGAAILAEGRCLATQRGRHMANPLEWEFPGGKVEPGEDPREALVREIREELNLRIEVLDRLGTGIHRTPDRTVELTVFTARLLGGRLHLAEHHAHGWFDGDEIDSLHWSAADVPLLEPLKQRLAIPRSSH